LSRHAGDNRATSATGSKRTSRISNQSGSPRYF